MGLQTQENNGPTSTNDVEKHKSIEDQYFRVFSIVLTIGLVAYTARAIQIGISLRVLITGSAMLLLWIALVFRNKLPRPVLITVFFTMLLTLGASGTFEYGLISPVIPLFAVTPILTAAIWGMRAGIASLVFAVVVFIFSSFQYLYFKHPSPSDLNLYNYATSNWAFALVVIVSLTVWGLSIVIMQNNFWDKLVAEKEAEGQRRQDSEVRRDQAEEWWRATAENVPGVIFEYVRYPNKPHAIPRMSSGSVDFWGLRSEEIEKDIKVLTARFDEKTREIIETSFATSMKNMSSFSVRLATSTIHGEEKHFRLTARPSSIEGGSTLWHCLVFDITTEILASNEAVVQKELAQQAQRQKSIGQLTGGVAHDFNNLLAVILGNLELLKEDITDKELVKFIDNATAATEQGADLTKNMLAFSRQAPLNPTLLDLNELVRNSQNWISRTIPSNITFEATFFSGLWNVTIDESSAVSAILNLVVNARDAMPSGGKITIETANILIDENDNDLSETDLNPGRYVMLSISDTGTGIPEDLLGQIFEPFFTTKGPGAGTGLGLSTIQGFMKQSGGTVRAYSEEGVGTTFKLFFSAHSGSEEPITEKRSEKHLEVTKGARVLLVEDETGILNNLSAALKRAGYLVEAASSGDQAATIYKSDPNFDLVVTDIVMPGILQGTTLSILLRDLTPDLPMVFMSGYANEETIQSNGLLLNDIRLTKPIRRVELIDAIENALASANNT